jgi:ABC-2 type transport system permease protein
MVTDHGATVVAPSGRSPGTVVARLTAKRAARSGALWGYFFGICVASSAFTYLSSYKTPASRAKLAASFGSNTALASLFGPAHQLQTVAGFTAYKVLTFLSVTGAVWGLLAGTRLLRGEEDAGRWELLLAGQTTRRQAAAQAIAGLGAGLAALFAVTAVVTVVTGRSSKVHFSVSEAVFLAVALVCLAGVFLAVGALASQLAASRRQAAAYSGYLLGACYALRMVADSGVGLEWLRWTTPFGWVELMQPLTASDWMPLIPTMVLILVLVWTTVHLAGTRDVAASILADRSSAPMRPGLLNGAFGLSARLGRPSVVAWGAALAVTALIFGFIAKPAGAALSGSNSVDKVLARLGARGSGAEAYLAIAFLMMAIMLVFVAAGQVTAARNEEADGRLDVLLVRPVSRRRWLGGRVIQAACVLLASGLGVGALTWLGAASNHAGLSFLHIVDAGLNIASPAILVLGAGTLVIGTWPRATSIATYGLIVWSILVEVIGGFANGNRWLVDTSVFHQMAAAPASPPNWAVSGAMIAIGAVAAAVGGAAFQGRDLAPE